MAKATVTLIEHGGEAAALCLAWKQGGGDWLEPYRVKNGLTPDLRPATDPEAPPRPPPYPSRVRAFIYGCGLALAKRG